MSDIVRKTQTTRLVRGSESRIVRESDYQKAREMVDVAFLF